MFQSLHILLEVCYAGLRLEHRRMQGGGCLFEIAVKLLVIHQCSHSSLPRIDLATHRIQMRGSQRNVLDGLLAAIQDSVGLPQQIRHLERCLTLDSRAVSYLSLPERSK